MRGVAKSAGGRSRNAAHVRKKARSTLDTKRGDLIAIEDRNKAIDFLNEGAEGGLPLKAIADFLGICVRTLRPWRMDSSGQGFSFDRRKVAPRQVAHKFTPEERQKGHLEILALGGHRCGLRLHPLLLPQWASLVGPRKTHIYRGALK